jgi:putative SbcD/Mre11-related phosphoesterase
MEILKNIEIIDLALYLKKEKILIIADTHIGYEESLNKQGILIPRTAFKDLIIRIEKILKKLPKLKKIIINGDIKHEFGKISETEWRNTLKFIDFLGKYSDEMILIKGNHDKILLPIAQKRDIKIVDSFKIDNILILHGDKAPNKDQLKNIKTVLIGHEHPAVTIRDSSRQEKYKCFLRGRYQKKVLIVQPSFNLVTEGTDISQEKVISPLLRQDLSDFEVFVVSDRIYQFGKLKNLV